MRNALAVMLVVAVGCSKGKQDDCQRFIDKSKSTLEAMGKSGGKQLSSGDLDQMVTTCREVHGKPGNKDDELMACVLAGGDDAAVATCWNAAFGSYMSKGKKTEAQLQLTKLGKDLKVLYMTNGAFPIGKSGPTPAASCCTEPGHKCAVTDAWTKDPVWSGLEFQIDEPTRFTYSYESTDGKSAIARAIGDLDCDGTAITYTLTMTADASGNPSMQISEPPAGAL